MKVRVLYPCALWGTFLSRNQIVDVPLTMERKAWRFIDRGLLEAHVGEGEIEALLSTPLEEE